MHMMSALHTTDWQCLLMGQQHATVLSAVVRVYNAVILACSIAAIESSSNLN